MWVDEIEKDWGIAEQLETGDFEESAWEFLNLDAGKSKPVFVIATANNIDALPPELLRKGRLMRYFC
ncbi:AAA family ATPase [Bacillus licheniformis]|nr:AAA family ATPase [Bacillus licheniformis]